MSTPQGGPLTTTRSKDAQSTYSELAELIALLPVLVREHRRRNRLSMREAARQIGCAPSTISRLDAGFDVSSHHVTVILHWLDGVHLFGDDAA